jgi:hypothetical protein
VCHPSNSSVLHEIAAASSTHHASMAQGHHTQLSPTVNPRRALLKCGELGHNQQLTAYNYISTPLPEGWLTPRGSRTFQRRNIPVASQARPASQQVSACEAAQCCCAVFTSELKVQVFTHTHGVLPLKPPTHCFLCRRHCPISLSTGSLPGLEAATRPALVLGRPNHCTQKQTAQLDARPEHYPPYLRRLRTTQPVS